MAKAQFAVIFGDRFVRVRIPIEAGQVFRGEAGHRSDLKPAGIPISFRPPD